ncbi:hypothetical protein LguiA_014449 [Lonicera macranthoides]
MNSENKIEEKKNTLIHNNNICTGKGNQRINPIKQTNHKSLSSPTSKNKKKPII